MLQAGTEYAVTVNFTPSEDLKESVVDTALGAAPYEDVESISYSDIGAYSPVLTGLGMNITVHEDNVYIILHNVEKIVPCSDDSRKIVVICNDGLTRIFSNSVKITFN